MKNGQLPGATSQSGILKIGEKLGSARPMILGTNEAFQPQLKLVLQTCTLFFSRKPKVIQKDPKGLNKLKSGVRRKCLGSIGNWDEILLSFDHSSVVRIWCDKHAWLFARLLKAHSTLPRDGVKDHDPAWHLWSIYIQICQMLKLTRMANNYLIPQHLSIHQPNPKRK